MSQQERKSKPAPALPSAGLTAERRRHEPTYPVYAESFGDDRLCACGHIYYRHFDTYDGMKGIGCKYCSCPEWTPLPADSARDGLNAKCRTHGNEHPDALCPQREAVSEAGLSKEREAEIRRRLEESRDGVESSAWFDAHVREDVDYLLAKLDRLRTALRAVEAERHFVLDEDKKRAIVADAAIKAADSAIERIATLERQLAAVRELADRWEHEGGDFAPVHLRQKCAAELRAAIAPPPSGKP